jgi:hypothetical protein
MKRKYIKKICFTLGIVAITFNYACSNNISKYIPNNLDIKKNIPLLQKVKKNVPFTGCKKEPELCNIFEEFNPVETVSGNYIYHNIKIQIYIIKFSSCDDAFGFYSALNNIPDRLWNEGTVLLSFKKPYYTGYKGKHLIVFKSTPSNYFNFYKSHTLQIINSLDKSPSICKLKYHHKILPKENRYRNSLFFARERQIGPFDFDNVYGAYYQTGRVKSVIYIDNSYNEKDAIVKFNQYIQNIQQDGLKIKKYTKSTGGMGTTYWFNDGDKYTMIHRYRWLNIVIKDITKLSYGQNFIRIMYGNMIKIRKEVKLKK